MNSTKRSSTQRLRWAVILLAALTSVAACGGSGGGGAAAGEGDADTLTVWHYFTTDAQVGVMKDFAKRFEQEHGSMTVENVYVPYDQMNNKVVSAAGSQTGPDVVVFNGAETAPLALGGALAPLDDYWASYDDADQVPESVQHRIDDQLVSVQGYVNLLGLWYNADILKEIGVEPPTTLEELEAAMEAAKAAGYEGITMTGLPQSQGEWQAYPWLTSQGFTYDDPDAESLSGALEMVQGWVEDGYLSREVTTWDQTVPFQQFTAGDVAFAENGNWQMAAAEKDADFDYGVVPLPLGEQGQVYLGGEGVAIGAHSDKKDLAWDYITSTFLNPEAEIAAAEAVGYIPARLDAAQDEAVTSDPLLKPFATSMVEMGANYPATVIPAESVADVQSQMGQTWSSVLGGSQDPQQAAERAVAQLESLQ